MKRLFSAVLLLSICIGAQSQNLNENLSYHEPSSLDSGDSCLVESEPFLVRRNIPIPEDSLVNLYHSLKVERLGLNYSIFRYGMVGFLALKSEGKLNGKNILSIIDFTQSSKKKRFYTIDLEKHQLIFNTLVSHGRNTGEDMAKAFSDTPQSNQSSLGFYVTGEVYEGSKGYSLRLDGMENGFNGNMRSRAVVMHSAAYVSEEWIRKYGRLGRSQGCPALPKNVSQEVIDTIKDKTAIFAYFEDPYYLQASSYLNGGNTNSPQASRSIQTKAVQH